jgi:hypothetical protein
MRMIETRKVSRRTHIWGRTSILGSDQQLRSGQQLRGDPVSEGEPEAEFHVRDRISLLKTFKVDSKC